LMLVALAAPVGVRSQVYSGVGGVREVYVGSETESYLHLLALTDTMAVESWSIRPLGPHQLATVANPREAHPWQTRLTGRTDASPRVELKLLSPSISQRFNSGYPYGSNDGAIWAGSGLTTAAQAGLYAKLGALTLTFLPTVFRAENSDFTMAPSVLPCGCGNALFGEAVDRPQRFGTEAYQRFDLGQSSIRVDALGVTAGLSTANQWWGPAGEYPFILGNNAPGFPHLFFGSSKPVYVLIGKAHVKVIYGRLDQSDYSPVTGSKFYASPLETGRVRFASGLVATIQPRGIRGLEVGGARFIHSIWPGTGLPPSYFRKPLQAFLKVNTRGIDQQVAGIDNQEASFFARWTFREAGLDVYGEYGREDSSYDLRDFAQEPDHQRAYSLGLTKVMGRSTTRFSVLRLELMNFQLPPLATTGRGEGSIYIHSPLRQGHTNRGQLLGADIGVSAAAASTVRWDHYSTGGRWAAFWKRNVRQETGDPPLDNPGARQVSDVQHAFGFERLRFTRRFDVTTSLTLMRDLSRDLSASRFNANAAVAFSLPK